MNKPLYRRSSDHLAEITQSLIVPNPKCSFPVSLSRIIATILCLCWMAGICFPHAPVVSAEDFENGPASVLIRRCLECHQSVNPSGNLVLVSRADLLKGGDSGPAIVPGDADASLLFQRVHAGEMPPLKRGLSQKLPDHEAAVLRAWINQGAEWPEDRRLDLFERSTDVRGGRDWWSLQPVVRPTVPTLPPEVSATAAASGDLNPIDAFVLQAQSQAGVTMAPPADRKALLRRLSVDVTGLPPSAEQIARMASAQKGAAGTSEINAFVDELLSSVHFGERWARHWLDVVRYAESCGYERDQHKPFAWKYRDWVVNAFNSDMPYDEFIRQQIAGDELPERSEQTVIATGFLRLGTWNDEPNDPQDYLYERLEDLVHSTSSAFLAMTVKCARCHDHKFDPIPQTDYYRMASAFWAGPIQPRDSRLLGGPTSDELGIPDVLGWTDITRSPAPLHLLKNGERHHPQQAVEPASLSFVDGSVKPFATSDSSSQKTTGRRVQLAAWIADSRNPLTARVIVNRIWLHYFGEGIVRSPDNFGYTGDKPTHPELLDWLADELIRGGWKLKPIHRLILTSQAYQQSSIHPLQEKYNQTDAGNRWLWRANRRRLDAESLRDAMLASTGELDLRTGGPGFFPSVSEDALEGLSRKASAWTASSPQEQRRRSLYIFSQRSLLPPLMTTFDQCDTTLPCGKRDVTIVAPQALTLLNNEFVHTRAEFLAGTVVQNHQNAQKRIDAVWQAVLGRAPDSSERAAAMRHMNSQLERFQRNAAEKETSSDARPAASAGSPEALFAGAVLHLRADTGVECDAEGRVKRWQDARGHELAAIQNEPSVRPNFSTNGINQKPAVIFDGSGQWMALSGPLLSDDTCTMFAVVADRSSRSAGNVPGHREILSNWNGAAGNSTSSLFLGLTGADQIRFSDAFSPASALLELDQPMLLTAINGPNGVEVFQQQRSVGRTSTRLPQRRLDTSWVIGQQGNIQGEYWHGPISEILVFDRQLTPEELRIVQGTLIQRYELKAPESESQDIQRTPEELALASLCLVLMNSNEFLYVD